MKNRKKKLWLVPVLALLICASFINTGYKKEASKDSLGITQNASMKEDTNTDTTKADSTEIHQVGEMKVHFIDVGQGDATLITSGDSAMLIDAGDNSKGTAVQLYLKKQGITKLDYLVLTHPDADHIGGADVIISKFEIETVFMSEFAKSNKTNQEVLDALKYKNLSYVTPKVGEKYTLGDATFTIIAPNDKYSDANNSSVGLLLENGENTFLFTGDAEEEAESDILKNKIDIDADVYKAGHHGSKTASSMELLKEVSPEFTVISCAQDNSYGHPHAQTLNSLRTMGSKVYRTDEQGSIIATSDGKEITWNCSPTDTWKAGEPTGSSSKSDAAISNDAKAINDAINNDVLNSSASNKQEVEQPAQLSDQQQAVDNTQENVTYVLNTNTMKFHIPTCSSVGDMKEKNKKEVNVTKQEVEEQGYVGCKRCNP